MRCLFIYLVIFLAFLAPLHAQSGWYLLQQGIGSETNNDVIDICFTSETTGYVVGERASAYRTTDGGLTWERMSIPASGHVDPSNYVYWDLFRVWFTSDKTGFACSNNWGDGFNYTGWYRTDDAGKTWSSKGGMLYANDIYFPTPEVGYVVGGLNTISIKPPHITKTSNSGVSWTSVWIDNRGTQEAFKVRFRNEYVGIVTLMEEEWANHSHIWSLLRTADGGEHWDTILWNGEINSIAHVTGTTWVLGADSGMYRSTDDGLTWTSVILPSLPPDDTWITNFAFPNDSIGYAAAGRYILKTTDGGLSWGKQSTPLVTGAVRAIVAPNASVAYAVCSGDTILKTTEGGGFILAAPIEHKVDVPLEVRSVSSDQFRFSFNVSLTDRVLLIYSTLGTVVCEIRIEPGRSSLTLDTHNLPHGSYWCRFGNQTARFIVQ